MLIVPGTWTEAQLDYHARQVASMLAYNCGFNRNGARLIVMAEGWPHQAFVARVKGSGRPPAPTTPTQDTWKRFTEQYPNTCW